MPIMIGIIIGLICSAALGAQAGALVGLAAAVIVLYVSLDKKYTNLIDELGRLRREISPDDKTSPDSAAPLSGQPEASQEATPSLQPADATVPPDDSNNRDEQYRRAEFSRSAAQRQTDEQPNQLPEKSVTPMSEWEDRVVDNLFSPIFSAVKRYFTDGNLFVRIGILILFIGVAFLLKYAAEHSTVPIEYRISGVILFGVAVLIFGWRLRTSKRIYSLLLQGCGIGILYLAFFSAFRIYDLIPPTFTFVMLVALAATSAALAVLQDSKALAAFGITGGFVAPILASTGSGNYIALFSYYLILNAGIISIAWFKAWRIINLLGFNFTYLVFIVWVVTDYKTSYLASSDPFLIAFFGMFSVASVLFALRQPIELKGYVDSSLVFGNPLVVWSLQMWMIKHVEYGIAISAFLFGFYHVSLARYLWNKHQEGMRLYAEALLAVGVIFLTLAIPYSLDGHWTSATWALEGAGILWVALRQQRKLAQYFAIALQIGAAIVFFLQSHGGQDVIPIANAVFLGGAFIAASGFFSAWQLYRIHSQGITDTLPRANVLVYLWALIWWLATGINEIFDHVDPVNQFNVLLLFIGLSSGSAWYLGRRLAWQTSELTAVIAIPAIIVIGFISLLELSHPINIPGVLVWGVVGVWSFWLLRQLEVRDWTESSVTQLHIVLILFLTLLLTIEFRWQLNQLVINAGIAWSAIFWMAIPLLLLWHIPHASHWPFSSYGLALRKGLGIALVGSAFCWSLAVNFINNGSTNPLPYLPFINPLDITHMILVMLSYKWLRQGCENDSRYLNFRNFYFSCLGVILFVWINAVQLRTIHQYFDISFNLNTMLNDLSVQVSLSILWTVIGMLAMLFAAKRHMRNLWIAGAVLVGVVLIKLIAVDLAASGTVERIVSFLAVGILLVGMGYFSPIPDKDEVEADVKSA